MGKFHRIIRSRGYGGLKILVLYVLSEGPKNGAELMDAIDLMSHGHWRPSPGSMYPLLSKAVEEKLIVKRDDRRYELTDTGLEEITMFRTGVSGKPETVEGILTDIDNNLSYLEDLPTEKITPYIRMIEAIREKMTRIHETVHPTDPQE